MPKLYYSAQSCGAASYIASKIAGVALEYETVDIPTHKTGSGKDFYTINPKGNVPALILDDGTILNENVATLNWIADQNPGSNLAPARGTSDYYLMLTALSFVATELHGAYRPLFTPNLGAEEREKLVAALQQKIKYVNDVLVKGKDFVVGQHVTVADLYLFICLSWSQYLNVDLSGHPNVQQYISKMSAHPQVAPILKELFG